MTATIFITFIGLMASFCSPKAEQIHVSDIADTISASITSKNTLQDKKLKKAYFASGCFWCVEAIYESVEGVEEVISGYSGGTKPNPTYEEIGTGTTGHAEAVEVYYNPAVVDYKTLVEVFYGSHDPTTVNGQHPDYGSQYRSMIYYLNDDEKRIAKEFKSSIAKEYEKPIATEIVPFTKFWKAEEYHQDFERLHPDQGYIVNVSIPRLRRFQAKYPKLLKKELHD